MLRPLPRVVGGADNRRADDEESLLWLGERLSFLFPESIATVVLRFALFAVFKNTNVSSSSSESSSSLAFSSTLN